MSPFSTMFPRAPSALASLGAALSLWLGAVRAEASGFAVSRFASEHGHPTTDNATALYFNPAALTQAGEARLFADLSLAFRRVTYLRTRSPRDAPDPPDASGANVGRAELDNFLLGPALGASVPLFGFTFAAGWFTPFGGPLSWSRRERFADHPRYPGLVDGVTRFHAIEGQIYTSVLSFGAARKISERISLGAALNLMGSLVHDVRARGDGTNDVTREGRALLSARGLALGFGAGALFELSRDRLFVGVSYQSRPNVRGGMTLSGRARGNLGTTTLSDVDLHYDLPDVIRVGARYRPESRIELRLSGDFTRWSAFDRQCISVAGSPCEIRSDGSAKPGSAVIQNLPRNFRDSVGLRAGSSIFVNRAWEVFSGIGFDTSAVPETTLEPALPDWTSVAFSLGARRRLGNSLRVAASYSHLLFVPRDATSTLASQAPPSKQPDASGHYAQFAGVLDVNVEYRFVGE